MWLRGLAHSVRICSILKSLNVFIEQLNGAKLVEYLLFAEGLFWLDAFIVFILRIRVIVIGF